MSKYDALWRWIRENGTTDLTLSFDEIAAILGFPLDHAFLHFKKELSAYSWQVVRISMKEQIVRFERLP